MREANSVLRRLEDMFEKYPDVDTGSLVTKWADELRTEYESRVRSSQQSAKAIQEMQYYGLAETAWKREENGNVSRYAVHTHRISPKDFPAFCKDLGLDQKKLMAVAMGDREMYEGFMRAPQNGFMLGHEYRAPKDPYDAPPPKRPRVSLFPKQKPEGKEFK